MTRIEQSWRNKTITKHKLSEKGREILVNMTLESMKHCFQGVKRLNRHHHYHHLGWITMSIISAGNNVTAFFIMQGRRIR